MGLSPQHLQLEFMKKSILSLILLLHAGCQTTQRADVSREADIESAPLSLSLISRVSGGIYVLDTAQRKLVQIHEVKDGGEIKYSFKKKLETSTYEFIYTSVQGPAPKKIQTFVFDRSSFTSSAPAVVEFGDEGQFHGPEFLALQNRIAVVRLDADRTSLHGLDLPAMASATSIVDEPLRVSGDLCCEGLPTGLIFAGFFCTSNNLIQCFGSDKTLQAIYFAHDGQTPIKLTFPEVDARISQSLNRPSEQHLGDVDPRLLETDLGKSLVFQRIFTTPDLFAGNAAPEMSEYLSQGFAGSYYKIIHNLDSPDEREFRLNYDSWVLDAYPESQRSTVAIRSYMWTPDIRVASDDPSKLDIVIGANLKASQQVNGAPFEFNGLLRGRFEHNPEGSSDTIAVEHIAPVLEMREFACAMWDKAGLLDQDGTVNLFLPAFFRFMDENLITFSAQKVPLFSKDRLVDIDGVKYVKNLGTSPEPFPVEEWRSLFCKSSAG